MMEVVKNLRQGFASGVTHDVKWRKQQLLALHQMLVEHEVEACQVLADDLKKPKLESMGTEVNVVKMEIKSLITNLDHWSKTEKVAKSFLTLTDTCYIQKQPYGVVFILGAWNYPVQLTLCPLAGAIAGGNCVLLKPSEVSSHTEAFLMKYIPQYLDEQCFRVVRGGVEETTDILKERFDLIFYTGNPAVAKIVMTAAAKHLTPVVLELGGKSPTYVSDSANLEVAAHRIAWGKFINAGQTCVAPDYVLCNEEVKAALIPKLEEAVKEFYGKEISKSADFARIINQRHFSRITQMLAETKGQIHRLGEDEADIGEKFLPPTIVTDVDGSDAIMQQEIFGPLLPIITVSSPQDAISFINEREKPLALYIFSSNSKEIEMFEKGTTSGGFLINDTVMHCAVEGLPFGGVGNSGTGAYHGRFSFDAFTHRRACMNKSTNEVLNYMAKYPPYTDKKLSVLNWAMGSNPQRKWCNIL